MEKVSVVGPEFLKDTVLWKLLIFLVVQYLFSEELFFHLSVFIQCLKEAWKCCPEERQFSFMFLYRKSIKLHFKSQHNRTPCPSSQGQRGAEIAPPLKQQHQQLPVVLEPQDAPWLLPASQVPHAVFVQDTRGGLKFRWRAPKGPHTFILPKCCSHYRPCLWCDRKAGP